MDLGSSFLRAGVAGEQLPRVLVRMEGGRVLGSEFRSAPPPRRSPRWRRLQASPPLPLLCCPRGMLLAAAFPRPRPRPR